MSKLRVAAIQHDITWEDPDANFAHLTPLLTQAADAGARLALLTEMYATGFSMETERIAEQSDGPSAQFLSDQAHALNMWIGASVPERRTGSVLPCNQFVLAGPDGTTHRYA